MKEKKNLFSQQHKIVILALKSFMSVRIVQSFKFIPPIYLNVGELELIVSLLSYIFFSH